MVLATILPSLVPCSGVTISHHFGLPITTTSGVTIRHIVPAVLSPTASHRPQLRPLLCAIGHNFWPLLATLWTIGHNFFPNLGPSAPTSVAIGHNFGWHQPLFPSLAPPTLATICHTLGNHQPQLQQPSFPIVILDHFPGGIGLFQHYQPHPGIIS